MARPTNVKALHTLQHYVDQMTSGQRLCRRRGRHNWPSDHMEPGKKLPRGIDTPVRVEGVYQITEYCIDCSKECTWTTQPNGVYDIEGVVRRYKDPKGWVKIPSEIEAFPRNIKAVMLEECHDLLFSRAAS